MAKGLSDRTTRSLHILDRVQSGEDQARSFLKAAHDIHGMYCLASRPFHKVVDGGNNHKPATIQFKTDVAVVGARNDLRFRKAIDPLPFLYNSDERFLTI